jgi:hypothetical protein
MCEGSWEEEEEVGNKRRRVERRRRGMQPVPVQRSRILRGLGFVGCCGEEVDKERKRRLARWRVYDSVSGLDIDYVYMSDHDDTPGEPGNPLHLLT